MKIGHLFAVILAFLLVSSQGTSVVAQEAQVDRTELPLKGPWYPPINTLDARDAKSPPVFEVKAPKGRPTSWSFCSTISGLVAPAPSVA